DSANFKHNKAQWRADALPFKCADRTGAISHARQTLTIESDMKAERNLSGRKVNKLTKKRHAHYMDRKGGMELDVAEDNFEDLFEGSPLYNSGGEEVVEAMGDSCDVREKGTEINKGSLAKTVRSSSSERQRLGGEDKGERVVALQEKEDMGKRLSDMMKSLTGAKSATAKLKKLWDKHRAEVDAPRVCGEIVEELEAASKAINELQVVVSKSAPEKVNEYGDKLSA
ncbi:unnamed protein product, partial [Prorocentrum cordatum]